VLGPDLPAVRASTVSGYQRTAGDRVVDPEHLRATVRAIFAALGMRDDDAALLADTLVEADLRGVHSHGVLRVSEYATKLRAGGVDPRGRPVLVRDGGAALVVDGGNSMGQVGATFAMRLAVERSQSTGLVAAAVRGSNHCGAMARFAMLGLDRDTIGLATTNALPTMAAWGGLDKIVGINPLAVAIPAGEEPPIVFDAAFSGSAHGKIRVYEQKGLPIPAGWAFDADGNPTTEVSDGIGVYGAAARKFITEGGNPGSGVFGFGPTNGVAGRSDGAGVRGTSTPGTGVFGTSASGVGTIGVSTSSVGVYGFSASAAGAFGKSASNVGLYGEGTQNAGVFGTSPVYGVWGRTNTGFGVNGEAVGNGVGVYGKAPAGGFAGYFEGRVFIAGVGILGSDSAMGASGSSAASSAEEVGEARLVEGRATVTFDGDAVAALGKGPYQVFLTPYGEHHRLFVPRRGPDGFEVRVQDDPTASGTFGWRAVARRSRADSRSAERSDAPRVTMPKDVPVPTAPAALPLPDAPPNAR